MSELEPLRPALAVDYGPSKPALLFGSDQRRRARAEDALAASGFRLVASLTLDEAAARLADQGSLGLVWLELGEEDATPVLDQLLAQLNDLAESRPTAVVACVPIELVDMVAARLTGLSDGFEAPPERRTASLVGGDGFEPPTLSV